MRSLTSGDEPAALLREVFVSPQAHYTQTPRTARFMRLGGEGRGAGTRGRESLAQTSRIEEGFSVLWRVGVYFYFIFFMDAFVKGSVLPRLFCLVRERR
ncbi:hypothetical protein LX32DRAFT_84261 [Colletotrichum zoysiae]|uniref:Uncharacterized protein n=1 Tax=Colletotrichum zoysiae TaxID=1216348 RepID=A0AAD9H972_9PEZI|nr:hypothetical protein LX32DRAFT_84261 [Colletotrichum zoysiae]